MFNHRTRIVLFFSTLLILIVFVITTLAIGQRGKRLGKPAQLKAELELYKHEYLLREPIIVKMRVTNIGKEEGWLYFVTKGGLKIKDSKGQEYTCHVSSSLAPGIIKPGQTLEEQTNLLVWFGIPESKFKIWHYLPLERYTILYKPRKDVSSETYEFSISEPKGDEIQAMNLLKDSYDLVIEKKTNEAIDKLDQLITKFPESAYTPHALWEMAVKYKIFIKDIQKTKETYQKLVDNYPHSREAIDALSDLVNSYIAQKDKASCVGYLNSLIQKYPNTDIAKEAEKQLKKVNDLKFEYIANKKENTNAEEN